MQEEKQSTEKEILYDRCPEPIYCEASGDYTLPDYQPEIRKILHIRACAMPAGKYTGGGKVEFAGTVSHTVLYADAEGKIACATLDADYDFSMPLPMAEEACMATADSIAETTSCRLGGPRKLTLRTRVKNTVHLFCREDLTPAIRGMAGEEDLSSLEELTGRMESMEVACGSSGSFLLTGTLRLDTPGAGDEVVWSGGNLLVSECRAGQDGCLCRGQAWIRCLLRPAEGLPYLVREKLPFEQFVPIAGMGERAEGVACGRILAVEATVLPGEGEECGTLSLSVSAEVDATATAPRLLRPVCDLYSTAYEMTCTYREAKSTAMIGAVMGNYTVSGSRGRGECEAENAAAILDADGRVEIEGIHIERGRAVVCGRVPVTVIFASAEEGQMPLGAAEIPVPFRVESELRPAPGVTPRYDCRGELIAARARIEPSAISVDAEIALSLSAYTDSTARLLEAAEPDRSLPVEHRGNRVFAVYPKEDDTLFSIGARYHKSRAAIAAQNGLGESVLAVSHLKESLDGVHHLLIED